MPQAWCAWRSWRPARRPCTIRKPGAPPQVGDAQEEAHPHHADQDRPEAAPRRREHHPYKMPRKPGEPDDLVPQLRDANIAAGRLGWARYREPPMETRCPVPWMVRAAFWTPTARNGVFMRWGAPADTDARIPDRGVSAWPLWETTNTETLRERIELGANAAGLATSRRA